MGSRNHVRVVTVLNRKVPAYVLKSKQSFNCIRFLILYRKKMFSMTRPLESLLLLALAWKCLLVLRVPCVSGQDYVDECPEPNGVYPDPIQCDRYYECKDSKISDKLCPDGLVYDEASFQLAQCSLPFSVDCKNRTVLQKAQPSPHCPRKNGYFVHEDPTVCNKFYFCGDGIANPLTCPESLIFNPKNGQCGYSKQVNREGCSSSDVFKFTCPKDPNNPNPHPTYADPTDCQYYFLCVDKKDARRNGCQAGSVFNEKTSLCDKQENLDINDPCRGHFNETYLEGLKGGRPSKLAAGFRKTGTGIQLDTKNRQRVPVVRRKNPRPQPDVQSPPSVQQPKRKRVRVRVKNPNLPGFSSKQKPVAAAGPQEPPQIAFSNDE